MNTNPTPDALAERLRSYAGTCTGLEPKRIMIAAATRLEALQAQPVGERDREYWARVLHDAWPHTVISQALSELTGLPIGTVLSWDAVKEAGADCSGLYRFADAVAAALTASPPVVEREAVKHLIPDEIDIYRILKSAGRSRLEMVKAMDEALTPLRAILALTPVEGVGVSEERSKFRTIGENWSTAGRLEVPLAMGPRLSDAAKERLRKLEELDAVALIEACKYPMGSRFTYHDEEGEHDPAYVVIPGGEMVPINGYDDGDAPIPTDVARAAFIVTACNVALSTPVAQGDEVRGFVRDFRSRANQCRTNNVAHCPEAASVWDLAADALEGKS